VAKLDFGAAFSRVFNLYGKHFVPLITYSAIFYGAIALFWAIIAGVLITSLAAGALFALIGVVLSIIASMLITGAYIIGLDAAERTGEFPPFSEVWPKVTPKIGPLFITSLLSGLGIMAGLILLVIPGLVLATWWFVAAPVVMLEDKSGASALGRSRELVRGNGWTVFGLFVVVSILVGIVGGVLGGIVGAIFGFNDIVETFATEFVPGVLTGPIQALLAVVVYQSLVGSGPSDGTLPPPPQQPGVTGQVQPPAQPPLQSPPGTPGTTDPGASGPFV
jgi:hypothetical protein